MSDDSRCLATNCKSFGFLGISLIMIASSCLAASPRLPEEEVEEDEEVLLLRLNGYPSRRGWVTEASPALALEGFLPEGLGWERGLCIGL